MVPPLSPRLGRPFAAARRAWARPGVRILLGVLLALALFPWVLVYLVLVLHRFGGIEFWMPKG